MISFNVRRARLAAGWTQAAVASRAGLSRIAYRSIEAGASTPRPKTLTRLAAALRTTPEYLLADFHTTTAIRLRTRRGFRGRDNLIARVTAWLETYSQLEDAVHDHRRFLLHPIRSRIDQIPPGPDRLDAIAATAKRALDIPVYAPIPDLCGALENRGIKVYPVALSSPSFTSLSIAFAIGGPLIAVNVWHRIPVEHRIFAAAREVGHLLLHATSYDVTRTAENRAEAREADLFADAFLMPHYRFRKKWEEARGLPFVDRVLKLKRYFKVPWPAVLRHAFPDPAAASSAIRHFPRAYTDAIGKPLAPDGEPMKLSPADFLPTRLPALVRAALDRGILPLPTAARLLDLTIAELRDRMASWLPDTL